PPGRVGPGEDGQRPAAGGVVDQPLLPPQPVAPRPRRRLHLRAQQVAAVATLGQRQRDLVAPEDEAGEGALGGRGGARPHRGRAGAAPTETGAAPRKVLPWAIAAVRSRRATARRRASSSSKEARRPPRPAGT